LVRDLEETLRLREGLELLREQGELGAMRRPRRRLWLAAACALLATVSAFVVHSGLRHVNSPLVAASVTALATGRQSAGIVSAAATRELALPASGVLELRALTPTTDASRTYDVSLEMTGGQPVRLGSVDHLTPDADGFVVLYADAAQLKPGEYVLIVEPETREATADQRFGFRLNRK
jgi:hypothetical protein